MRDAEQQQEEEEEEHKDMPRQQHARTNETKRLSGWGSQANSLPQAPTTYKNVFRYLLCVFPVLVEGFGEFRARIQILCVKKLPGDTSSGLET